MRERIELPCPACAEGQLLMQITVNDYGNQYFADGSPQRRIACGNCGSRALVTLHGTGEPLGVTLIPSPARIHQQDRGHSTHR